ncbi:MAG: hypothetical protein AAGE76_10185 [Pseudomonadota bacterium]
MSATRPDDATRPGPRAGASRAATATFALLGLSLLGGCAERILAADRAAFIVEGAQVVVAAPAGRCIDPKSVELGSGGGFLLIGDCALFLPDTPPAGGALMPGLIRVGVTGAPAGTDLAAFEAFLSADGRAALSASRSAEEIAVLARRADADGLFLKIADSAAGSETWRVFFPAGPRVLSATFVPLDAPVTDTVALEELRRVVRATRGANV